MIKLNPENSNDLKAPLGELASNTRLDIPNTTPTTFNKSSITTDNNTLQPIQPNEEFPSVFHNHLDWLTTNFERLTEPEFEELINLTGRGLITFEKGKSWSSGEKAKSYQNTINSPLGLKGAYNCYQAENSLDKFYDLTISLPGTYFSSLTAIEQWELCRDLRINYQASCSRTDTSIDDYSFENIPINEMIEAYRRGNYFGFKEYHHETDEKDPKNPDIVHYFGAKGSKRLVRVYKHKNQSLRLETQFRGKYAQGAFEAIATLERDDETDDEWNKIIQKTIGGLAVGAIDFRDKSKLQNPKKS